MKPRKTDQPGTPRTHKNLGKGRTDVEGQNPKANDSPDHDEHHDESRRNMYDEEVGKSLGGSKKEQ